MGVFYFDASIHPRAGFSLGGYVYSASPLESAVAEALRRSGFRPGLDEYKSGVRIPSEPAQAEARHKLRGEIRSLFGQIGIVVSPEGDRTLFAQDALLGLKKIVANNRLAGASHTAYFDEGVVAPPGRAKSLATELGIDVTVSLQGTPGSVAVFRSPISRRIHWPRCCPNSLASSTRWSKRARTRDMILTSM